MDKKKPENVQIGGRVKKAREAAGFTQERLAELLDVSAQYVSGVERGTVGLSVPILASLCKILLVSSDYILMGEIEYSDPTSIVSRLRRLPTEHIRNAEDILDRYLEGIVLAQRNAIHIHSKSAEK